MTLAELTACEAIRNTIARASQAGDHLVAADYADCFTPDGALRYGDALHKAGRAAIHGWVETNKRHEATRGMMRHNVTSTCITLTGSAGDPDGADVRSYYLVYTDVGPDHFGWYRDRFVPHGDRWLLHAREVGVDWTSPLSRFAKKA